VASTNEAAYFAWADSRRGTVQQPTEDYYFTSAVYKSEAGSTSRGTSSVVYFLLGCVVMLAVVGLVLLVVSRTVKGKPVASST